MQVNVPRGNPFHSSVPDPSIQHVDQMVLAGDLWGKKSNQSVWFSGEESVNLARGSKEHVTHKNLRI